MFTRNLIGSLSASAFRLMDLDAKIRMWFILQDLGIRMDQILLPENELRKYSHGQYRDRVRGPPDLNNFLLGIQKEISKDTSSLEIYRRFHDSDFMQLLRKLNHLGYLRDAVDAVTTPA